MGSLKRIKTATLSELMEVRGIGEELAKEIISFFHPA
jgi:ERCC4-type nuclease